MKLGLETDSSFFGIAGFVEVTLRDNAGKALAVYKTATCAIAGKSGGHARIVDFSTAKREVPKDIIARTVSLDIQPHVEQDNLPRPIGIRDWTIFVPIFQKNT